MSARYLLLLSSGPVMGSYDTERAPIALRAVRRTSDGKCDVLDLVDDQPERGEEVFLYRRNPKVRAGRVHVQRHGRGGRCGDWLTTLTYEYVGRLDRDTWELTEAPRDELEWWATQAQAAMVAWALGEPLPAPTPQLELFSGMSR